MRKKTQSHFNPSPGGGTCTRRTAARSAFVKKAWVLHVLQQKTHLHRPHPTARFLLRFHSKLYQTDRRWKIEGEDWCWWTFIIYFWPSYFYRNVDECEMFWMGACVHLNTLGFIFLSKSCDLAGQSDINIVVMTLKPLKYISIWC